MKWEKMNHGDWLDGYWGDGEKRRERENGCIMNIRESLSIMWSDEWDLLLSGFLCSLLVAVILLQFRVRGRGREV